jgi:diketogulonate reductase-like aldo/keto reductase
MLDHPLLKELAEKYGVSSAQVCIRFALQMKVLPLPKASSAERIRENADTGSFELSSSDMERVKAMPLAGWSGEHPDRPKTKAVAW